MEKIQEEVITNYKIENQMLKFNDSNDTQKYLNKIKFFLSNFNDLYKNKDDFESNILEKVSSKFLNTLNALTWKYKIDNNNNLSITPKSSGFPNFIEILNIKNEHEKSKVLLSDLPNLEMITNRFISEMLEKMDNSTYVKKMYSERKYNELISNKDELLIDFEIFDPIKENGLHKIAWTYYDSTVNLPVVYVMEYKNENHNENLYELKELVINTLKNSCNTNLTMYTVAREIDEKLEDISPKKLMRYIIGPFFVDNLTQNNEIIKSILEVDGEINKNILTWTKEVIYSYDEIVENGFFKSKTTQKFYIDKTSEELSKGGMSELKRYSMITYDCYQKYNSSNQKSLLDYSENHIIRNKQN